MGRIYVTFTDSEEQHIKEVCEKRGISKSEYVRELYLEGKKVYNANENIDFIVEIIDERLRSILKPNIERLAAISAKGAIMSASSNFLNAQTLAELLPVDKQYAFEEVYRKSRLKGIEYVKSRTDDNEEI